jgi:hypothetical protein
MQILRDISGEAEQAIRDGTGWQFAAENRSDPDFWTWLGRPALDVRTFLGLARYLDVAAWSGLPLHRRLELHEYDAAAAPLEPETRDSLLARSDAIFLAFSEDWPAEVVRRAAADVLYWSPRSGFLDEAHAAVFVHAFLSSADWPEMSERIIVALAWLPALWESPAFLAAAALAYGGRLVPLLASACLTSEHQLEIARVIERATGRGRWGRHCDEYARETLSWYENNRDRLVVDTDALYPAPPGPIFKLV